MRKILFRGKRESDGKWIYGAYADETVRETDFPCIMPLAENEDDGDWAVLPETVGQYTGLEDKNGKKIFEGDIVGCVHMSDDIYTDIVLVEDIKNIPSELFGSSLTSRVVVGDIYDNAYLMRGDQ